METLLSDAGAADIFRQADDANHLYGTAKMGFSAEDSVADSDCRTWGHRNIFICDGRSSRPRAASTRTRRSMPSRCAPRTASRPWPRGASYDLKDDARRLATALTSLALFPCWQWSS